MGDSKLNIRLFGAFSCEWDSKEPVIVRGSKHRALIALLATAAKGTHTRSWLQEVLWSLSGEEHGRASLRRALSDLRKVFGDRFGELFKITNIDIRLDLDRINLLGDHRDGEFLEGLDLPEPGYNTWLRQKRIESTSDTFDIPIVISSNITPSIAVIPFLAMTGSTQERTFSDLMALEVTRALSRSKLIDVISHLSSRQTDLRNLDMRQIRASLGANYIVYGTVQIEDGRFRIDADFADAGSGRIHWTQAFHGHVLDVLKARNEIVTDLPNHIGRSILSASVELARSRPMPNVESHALLMSSITFMHRHELANFSRSRAQLEELIRRAPDHSVLHAWLAKWYVLSIAQGWSRDAAADTQTAADCAKHALDINPTCSFSLAIDGMIQSNKRGDMDSALARFDEAVQIEPNNALAWLLYSRLHSFKGNGEDAMTCAERATQLSPIDPHKYFFDIMMATAHTVIGNYDRAVELAHCSLQLNPRHTSSYRVKAVALELMGRHTEAKHVVERMRKLEPNLTVSSYLANHPAADLQTGRTWAGALRDAGLPAN